MRKPAKQSAYSDIHIGIVDLLETARSAAARSVNALMTATYWEIGRRIVEHEQGGKGRAAYGEALVARLSEDLTERFGRGFSQRNLEQMRQFYLCWRIPQTVSAESAPAKISQTASASSALPVTSLALSGDQSHLTKLAARFPLPWSAYVQLLSANSAAARSFYETEALRSGWTVRQLARQIDSQFYERIALSRNKTAMLAKAGRKQADDLMMPEEAIKDPFVLEFLDLKDEYSESDLEDALIQNLADFLLELGDDYAFVGRQKQLRIDDKWFRVDLVFYHRGLKSLIVIDLKVGRFSHADAGQMHLYLNYARENWMKPGENPPVGLILCASKGAAEAHYALEGLPNKVIAAEYRTVLPDEGRIVEALRQSRRVLDARRRVEKPSKSR